MIIKLKRKTQSSASPRKLHLIHLQFRHTKNNPKRSKKLQNPKCITRTKILLRLLPRLSPSPPTLTSKIVKSSLLKTSAVMRKRSQLIFRYRLEKLVRSATKRTSMFRKSSNGQSTDMKFSLPALLCLLKAPLSKRTEEQVASYDRERISILTSVQRVPQL